MTRDFNDTQWCNSAWDGTKRAKLHITSTPWSLWELAVIRQLWAPRGNSNLEGLQRPNSERDHREDEEVAPVSPHHNIFLTWKGCATGKIMLRGYLWSETQCRGEVGAPPFPTLKSQSEWGSCVPSKLSSHRDLIWLQVPVVITQ